MEPFTAVKIADRVFWVGAIDWGIRNFHGYETSRGTTYNAYLVMADRVTLVDTVKKGFADEMLSRISSVVAPSKIELVVSHHSEMDHSGSLPEVIETVKPDKVFASANGVKALRDHFHLDHEVTAVADGEKLILGDAELTFLETKMLHWPDSMISYLAEERLVFSQDGFGMHLASSERFDDELDATVLEQEAAKYFANILLPFSPLVKKLIDRLDGLALDVKLLCPDHGPVWRKDVAGIIARWRNWAEQKPTMKAVVVYDSMWHSTEFMARAIADGLVAGRVTGATSRRRSSTRARFSSEAPR
jgi:flavorubredoxin